MVMFLTLKFDEQMTDDMIQCESSEILIRVRYGRVRAYTMYVSLVFKLDNPPWSIFVFTPSRSPVFSVIIHEAHRTPTSCSNEARRENSSLSFSVRSFLVIQAMGSPLANERRIRFLWETTVIHEEKENSLRQHRSSVGLLSPLLGKKIKIDGPFPLFSCQNPRFKNCV